MTDIERLAIQFRKAIELAQNAGEFENDFSFYKFPRACCGDASDLLAQFLLENGIKTWYTYGTFRPSRYEGTQTHAWLITSDCQIIDITGDQFRNNRTFLCYDKSVYVGEIDAFHLLFEDSDRWVIESKGINSLGIRSQERLKKLYRIIMSYLIVD